MKKNVGQSLIEVVFSIGFVMLVMTGVVALLISTIGARTKSYDRSKSVELSQIVMERIVNTKTTDPTNFWNLSSAYWSALSSNQTDANFPDYQYSVTAIPHTVSGCSLIKTTCMNVTVKIIWKDKTNEQFNRFFSRT